MKNHRTLRTTAALVILVVALAGAAHAYAWLAFRASFPPGPIPARRASIAHALSLEPWNRTFQARRDYVDAEFLLARNDPVGAYNVLHKAVYAYPGDKDIRALYHKVYPSWYEIESLKAHAQHGHEGPGGTLRPQDVER